MNCRAPNWLKKKITPSLTHEMKRMLRAKNLHSVCEEARCPNIGECFSKGTATFMILGDVCTRRCGFCAVKHGVPSDVDANEPKKVALVVKKLKLKHAVITSVTRDDIDDFGASHFARTVGEINRACPHATVEILVPDFHASPNCLKIIAMNPPQVFNHNVETTRELTKKVRDKRADYDVSLELLALARSHLPNSAIKSGLMVGLGESDEDVNRALVDLRYAGVHIVTIGQYLPPSKDALPAQRYVSPDQFEDWVKKGKDLGITVFAGPLVRSSYSAFELLNNFNNLTKSDQTTG